MNSAEIVREALLERGLETPCDFRPEIKEGARLLYVEEAVTEILNVLGMDLTDDSLRDTPNRVAKMYVNEIFGGLNYDNFPKITVIENKMNVDCMVIEKDITLHSVCEHHLVTIAGSCHIGYIPRKKVIGLSKMNRLTQFFASRPQVQERLTNQIACAMEALLETPDVMVMVKAKHYCVAQRGIKDSASSTITTSVSGAFEKPEVRAEFMESIR